MSNFFRYLLLQSHSSIFPIHRLGRGRPLDDDQKSLDGSVLHRRRVPRIPPQRNVVRGKLLHLNAGALAGDEGEAVAPAAPTHRRWYEAAQANFVARVGVKGRDEEGLVKRADGVEAFDGLLGISTDYSSSCEG